MYDTLYQLFQVKPIENNSGQFITSIKKTTLHLPSYLLHSLFIRIAKYKY